MPDLRQALRDFVTTSNSGKYATEEELMSKFPELQGYDIQALRDFVTTSNSGKYSDEETLFSKFPEFGITGQPVQQQAVQQQPAKKKELSALLLGDGLLDFLKSEQPQQEYKPTTPIPGTDYNAPQKGPIQAEVEEQKNKPALPATDYMQGYLKEEGKGVPFKEKKEYPRTFWGTKSLEQIEDEVPEFMKPVINNIDAKLLRQGKENAKKELNYYLWDAGFETKILSSYETGTAVDMISITAPDGEVRQFQVFSDFDNEANKIKQFVKEKSSLIPKKEEYWYQNQYRKFKNKEEIDNEVKSISNQENLINKEYNQYLYKQSLIKEWKADIKKMEDSGEQNTLKYKNWVANLKIYEAELPELGDRLKNKASTLIEQQKQLEKAAGKYLELQSEKGSFSGALYRSAMESAANIYSQYLRLTYSGMVELLPGSAVYSQKEFDKEYRKKLLNEGIIKRMDQSLDGVVMDKAKQAEISSQVDAELRDKLKKQGITGYRDGVKLDNVASVNSIRENISEFLNRPTSTTKEYKEKLEKEGSFVTRGLLGLSGSLPAMLGGPAIRITNMFMMTTDAAMREMDNDPDFANISENEKALVALPIGVVSAALEEVGFRNLVKGKSVTSDILKTVLNRVPSNASASLLRKTTLDVIAEMGIRGTTALVGAALSEAETGAAQQISEYIVKDSYNMLKGNKMFDNPEFLSSQYFYDIYDASRTEMVGGITLGVPYSISAAFQKDGFQALDDNTFKIFEELTKDGDSRKFFVTSLKNKINQGEITAKQSQQMLDAYDQASGMIAQVPDEITDSKARKIAMDLMSERKRLEQKKYGKDEALAKPIQDKIDNINKQLTQLTQDAIQKQTTGEVSVQPEAGAGQEMEVGGPEAKPQITAEESKRKEALIAALEAYADSEEDSNIRVYEAGVLEELPKKDVQAELDAIIAKEKAPVTEQGGMEQAAPAEGLGTQLEMVAKEVIPTKEEAPVQPAEKKPLNFAVGGTSRGYRVWQSGQKVEEGSVESKDPRELLRNSETTEITPEGSKTKIIGRIAEVREGGKVAYYAIAQDAKFDEGQSFTRLKDFVGRGGPISVMLSFNESDNVSMDDVKAALVEKLTEVVDKSVDKTTFQTNKPADLGTFEFAITPTTTPTATTPTTEVTPVEQQFTEQDRARKAELEEAMRKADKRRKNITVGETTMPKAEAKAELDALNQKEQAAQQPVTPTATAPVETMTAEQEADLLEELMTGKKKETAPVETAPAEPTSKEAIAKRLRGKKNKGLMSSIDFGISQALYNGALEFMASQVEKGTKLGNAIANTIKWIDEKMQGKSWDKDGFTKYANTTFEEVATKKKAKAILDVYPKGSVVGIADLASESGDTIISNVLSKMKDVFNKVKISGRRPTEGAAFYNYNTKEIDVNKNSPHWDEVEGDQIASALSHEFAHHLIDGHSEKEAIETDLQEIKDDLIANKPELTESQKKAYEFMTSKNNSPQEILTYAVSDPDIRPILTKYKDKLNNISNKLFGEDVISGIFEEQKSKTNEIQPQRTRDGRGRTESRAIAPLEGAPSVQGFVGPDPQLTAVAEEYAKENGIPYKRQAEYVKVDEDRAKRIAEAYEEMKHDPQNPKVKEAYENLIKQTIAQYEALVKAGYKFWFIDTNIPSNLEYAQSPFNAMRDVRSNKQMGVFPTTDGFGSSDVDVSDNPMMAETKFKWPVGGMDGELKPVLANDLFRAVHDAFGHGLEGAGFRARGEENAWQAHIRLFTGSAVGAITSETRGQNSWLNFGPHGEKNRTANTDETIFADQKTGLMPEWTWKEGVAADMETTAKPFATSLADAVRKNLTIKTGGLQSNILGVPIAIWNAGVLTAAKAIDASVAASKAIQQGVNDVKNWIKKNNPSLSLSDAKIKNKILIDLYEGTIKTARENNVKTEGLITYFKRKGLSDAQIDVLLKDEKKKAEKPELSEETLPGYTKLMNRINDIIARGRRNGKTDDDIMKGVIANVESRSPEYANATDQQREQIIRDIRKLFGKKEKAAPSAAKITGKAKPKKVTVDEMTALKDQLRLEAKAAREAKGDINTKRKMLADAIKKLADKGSITLRQAKALINKVNSVNLDNPVMVERLLDYAEKVFNDAEYAEKIERINSLLGKAKENVKTKIGVSEGLTALMNKLFSINPNIIPAEIFEAYSEIVEMMGKRQAVLTLKEANELTKDVEKVLDVITDELSNLDELIDIFDNYENKVLDKDGKIDFSATLDKMLEDGTITPNDVKLYKKYKNKVLPREAKEKKTEQQLAEEKKELIDAIRQTKVDESNLNMREERDAARNLISAMTPENLNGLTNAELANLLKVLDNINNGFFPHYAVKMTQKLNATNRKETLGGAIKTAGRLPLTKLIANIKSLFPGAKSANMIMVIESPKYVIDQVFGFFKKSPIYDSVFKPLTQAFATYKTDARKVKEKLDRAFNKVARSYMNNPVKIKMSQFKMMTYALQLEYQSNKDKGEGFYSAAEYIKETIKHARGDQSTMSKKDIKLLEKVLELYGVKDADGNFIDINIDKLYDSFNNAEKQAIETIQEVNTSIRDKAMFTAAVIRGDKMKPIDNYIHHNVLPTGVDDKKITSVYEDMNARMMPSTKATTLEERTKGAKPLNFNIFGATQRSANQVLMDFHLTETVRTSRMVLNELGKDLKENGSDKELSIFNAINESFKKTLENTLTNTFNDSTFADKTISMITKQSYRVLLAGASRWTAELISNLAYATLANPKAYMNGITKYRKFVMSEKGPAILQNIGSAVQDRIYEDSVLSGRMIDGSIMDEAIGLDGTTSNYMVSNAMQTIYNNTAKKVQNFVSVTADTLISTPDKIALRPFYFGVFAQNFKKETGQDVDFDKIAANDEAYLSKFKDVINKSKDAADNQAMLAGGTKNPFAARQKAMTVKGASAFSQIYQSFNNFMNNFIINEYIAARTGIYAMMGNGKISQRQGAAVLAGVVTRTTLYSLLVKELAAGFAWLFLGDDDEEDEEKEEKSLIEKSGQAFAGSMTSLILGRDFGNLTRNMINYGVEKVNENYVQKMIDGKYTKEDVIAFNSLIPSSLGSRPQFSDLLINMSGAGQPFLRSAKTLYETYFADEPKNEDTIKKRQNYWRYTLPLEIAGHLGFVPLYKDVKSITNKALQREVDKIKGEESGGGIIKRKKFEDYDSAEEFEMEDPEGYAKYEEMQKRHRTERRADKKELLNGYDSVKLFQESDEEGYLQAIKDGSIYEYQERERKRFEEKHEDEPFRGLSEEKFKKLYPTEWRKFYGPGTAYFKSQRTPEALKRKQEEKRQEALIKREEKKAEIKRKIEEAKRKKGY